MAICLCNSSSHIIKRFFPPMNFQSNNLSVNLLPPKKLYCDKNNWSEIFSNDMKILWDKCHGTPLNKIPSGASDLIFPYLLLALSKYKCSQKNKMKGIGLDNLLNLWFDKYSINRKGYFEIFN